MNPHNLERDEAPPCGRATNFVRVTRATRRRKRLSSSTRKNALVLLILLTLILREIGQDPFNHLFRPRSVIVTRGCGGHDRTAVLYPAVEEQLNGSTV